MPIRKIVDANLVHGDVQITYSITHYVHCINTPITISKPLGSVNICDWCDLPSVTCILQGKSRARFNTCKKCKRIFQLIIEYFENPNWITCAIRKPLEYAFLGKETTKKMRATAARYQVQLLIPTIYDIARVIVRYYVELSLL